MIEGRGFRDRRQEYDSKNVQVLGISFDTVEENAAFARKFDFNFPLLSDTSRAVGMAYGACEDPMASSAKRISYLIDEQGRIEKGYPNVDPTKHPADVLADV